MRSIQIMRMRPAYDAASAAYFAAMTVQPNSIRKSLIDNFVKGLKTDGLYSLLDMLHLIASHDAQAATLNLINPATATITLSGAPAFTTDIGYTTDGSTNFLNTNRAANAGGNFAQNSGTFGVYINSSVAGSGTSLAGAYDGSSGTVINPFGTTANSSAYRLNSGSGVSITGAGGPNNSLGLSSASRSSASAMRGWRNGVQVGINSTAGTSIALVATTFKMGAITTTAVRGARFAADYLGSDMIATQQLAFYNRLLTYLTAIGAN